MEEQRVEKLVVDYIYTYEEFKALERRTWSLLVLVWLLPTILLTSIFFLGYFLGNQKVTFFSLSTISFLIFFLLIFIAFYFSHPDTAWKSIALIPKDRRVTIENEGILLETPYSHFQCSWSCVRTAFEMKKLYVINTIVQQSIIIPKSNLKKNEELLLRTLIESHVLPKKIKFKKMKLE